MNKKYRIALDVLIIFIALVFLIFGIRDAIEMFKGTAPEDNLKFARLYPDLFENNIYVTADLKKTDKLLKSRSAVVLIGDHDDEWMKSIVKPLEDISKEYVDEIYHLDLSGIDTSSESFKILTEKTGEISHFKIIVIKDKTIVASIDKENLVDEDYKGEPSTYFTKEKMDSLKSNLKEISNLK